VPVSGWPAWPACSPGPGGTGRAGRGCGGRWLRGLCCIVGGDLVYALYERVLHEPAPFPSLADALYLAGCPLIGLSLVGLVPNGRPGSGELDRRGRG
jgi:hypothetical protein